MCYQQRLEIQRRAYLKAAAAAVAVALDARLESLSLAPSEVRDILKGRKCESRRRLARVCVMFIETNERMESLESFLCCWRRPRSHIAYLFGFMGYDMLRI